jgi:hypothetical protein
MRKYLLYVLIISFVLLCHPIIHAEEPRINLRSSFRYLSVFQVQSMSNVSIRKKHNGGFDGYGTIKHVYETKAIEGCKVVIDHATGLMWHQSGSNECMEWDKARDWVWGLNEMGYAGYNDWELPTVEEAISLLESSKKNDKLYIAPVFGNKQKWIWTGDRYDSGDMWYWHVHFEFGEVTYRFVWDETSYVRPVRSIK